MPDDRLGIALATSAEHLAAFAVVFATTPGLRLDRKPDWMLELPAPIAVAWYGFLASYEHLISAHEDVIEVSDD